MKKNLNEIIIENKNEINKYINFDESNILETDNLIKDFQRNKLYGSLMHGAGHCERVFLFAYIISKSFDINEVDLKIISDGALYHDMGRINDNEDTVHGYASTLKIDRVLSSDIYKDIDNLNILKAIIDAHSIHDRNKSYIIEQYNIQDVNRFEKLSKILKDADALDRCRFKKDGLYYLNVKYLRNDISKKLIDLSERINIIKM